MKHMTEEEKDRREQVVICSICGIGFLYIVIRFGISLFFGV